jgi:hypothetical protein
MPTQVTINDKEKQKINLPIQEQYATANSTFGGGILTAEKKESRYQPTLLSNGTGGELLIQQYFSPTITTGGSNRPPLTSLHKQPETGRPVNSTTSGTADIQQYNAGNTQVVTGAVFEDSA